MKLKTNRIARHLFIALGITAIVGAVAPDADACGGGWWPEVQIDHRVQGIASAEKDLAKGNYQAAAGKVLRMIPHIRHYKKTSGDDIVNRSMRVLAVATARSAGQLNLKSEIPQELHKSWLGESTKQANLDWSVRTLEAVGTWKKNDPTVQTELGEALAMAGRTSEAREVLGKLADKDLMSSAEGYAALASLRNAAGDDKGRDAALTRCRAMAKTPALCASTVIGQS